jgi:hypothetical protein
VIVVIRDRLLEYTCDVCDLDRERPAVVDLADLDWLWMAWDEPLLPEGWQERTPEVGRNYHLCAECVRREGVEARETA